MPARHRPLTACLARSNWRNYLPYHCDRAVYTTKARGFWKIFLAQSDAVANGWDCHPINEAHMNRNGRATRTTGRASWITFGSLILPTEEHRLCACFNHTGRRTCALASPAKEYLAAIMSPSQLKFNGTTEVVISSWMSFLYYSRFGPFTGLENTNRVSEIKKQPKEPM